MNLTECRRTGGAADQQREQAVAAVLHQRAGGERQADPQQFAQSVPVHDAARPHRAAHQQGDGAAAGDDQLLHHKRPRAGAVQCAGDAGQRAKPLADQRAQRQLPVGAIPGQQALDRPRRADQRQRQREGDRHRGQPAVAQRPCQRLAKRGLQHRGETPGRDRNRERAGKCRFVHNAALHQRVREQGIDADP